jgi:hypothetical protein
MLVGVALFMAALLAPLALLFVSESTAGRPTPLEFIGYMLAVSTAIFMWMFALFGDWRWVWLWIAVPFVFGWLGLSSPTGRALLAAIPAWAWPGAAVLAWIVFVAWYVRARRIGPVIFAPQPPAAAWARADLDGSVTRELALRALVTGQPPGRMGRALVFSIALNVGLAFIVVFFLMASFTGFFAFTSFVWPFAAMLVLWGKATAIVHRSRLLWLRMPGSRETVRREIERALLRNACAGVLVIVGVAAVSAASPLVDASPEQVLAGFALVASAALFSTYLAFASIPGRVLHLVCFAVMMALQLALLGPLSSPTTAGIVIAAQIGGAIALRALAMRRWRHVDWLRLRPLPAANLFRGA